MSARIEGIALPPVTTTRSATLIRAEVLVHTMYLRMWVLGASPTRSGSRGLWCDYKARFAKLLCAVFHASDPRPGSAARRRTRARQQSFQSTAHLCCESLASEFRGPHCTLAISRISPLLILDGSGSPRQDVPDQALFDKTLNDEVWSLVVTRLPSLSTRYATVSPLVPHSLRSCLAGTPRSPSAASRRPVRYP
jgi:hypothetical protein